MITMTISVNHENGIRHGTFSINGIEGIFPTQAITSTNLNHRSYFENPKFNFKTKVVEIIEFFPKKLVNDSEYRTKRSKIVSKMIKDNPNYLFLFTVKGARAVSYTSKSGTKISPFKFTKDNNESLIDFQKECEFPLIKVFFKRAGSIKDSEYFRNLIPKAKFVASIDENMSHNSFRTLYQECISKGDEIVSFFGRIPSKSKKQIHNQLNFAFLASRPSDKILRFASFTSKALDSAVLSLIYNWFSLDAYSFMTRRGSQDIPEYEMRALDGFYYKPLLKDTTLVCPITGKNLYESSKDFEKKYGKSSIPVTTHDIVRLNEQFEVLHEQYTREEIQEILADRI
ncbi:hypothetical protein NMT12_120104 [metagenome]